MLLETTEIPWSQGILKVSEFPEIRRSESEGNGFKAYTLRKWFWQLLHPLVSSHYITNYPKLKCLKQHFTCSWFGREKIGTEHSKNGLPLLHVMYAGLGYRILFPHSYTWSPSQDSLKSWSLAKHGSLQQWGKGSEVGGGDQSFKG